MSARAYLRWGGVERISKRQFYALGGLSHPGLFRKMRGGAWAYFKDNRH